MIPTFHLFHPNDGQVLVTVKRDDWDRTGSKVGVAIPFWRMMYSKSATNLAVLMMTFPFYSFHSADNFRVDRAREEMTEQFLKFSGTHMLCLDSDMEVPIGAVDRLLRHGRPIVGALYYSRQSGNYPLIWGDDVDGFKIFTDWPQGTLIEDSHLITGAGCLLIKREVFESFGPPWWILDEGDAGGTDIAFLRRAHKAGYGVAVDTSIVCGHYGVSSIGPESFEEWKREHSEEIIQP